MMTAPTVDMQAFALTGAGRYLGADRARALLERFLAERHQPRLRSLDDLRAFGLSLHELGGVERAVGAVLRWEATLLCRPPAQDHS